MPTGRAARIFDAATICHNAFRCVAVANAIARIATVGDPAIARYGQS